MPAKKKAKAKAIHTSEFDEMISKIQKDRGDNIITPARLIPPANHIPTGAFMLDFALLGGVPEGYATMFYGLESSGKTMLAKKTTAGFHAKHPDKKAVWIDAEGLFDKDWAETLGCDLDRLHVARPSTGNEAVDMIDALMEPEEVGLIVLDSVPGCVPKAIADRSAEDPTMGELARLMGTMCSKILCSWAVQRRRNHSVTIILINQFRSKVGMVFGDPRTLPGGRQINHLPSTKIELKNKEISGTDTFDTNMMIRNEHHFQITKAKHGRSVREGEFHMGLSSDSNDGIAPFSFINHKTVVAYAKRMGLLTGGGSSGFTISGLGSTRHRTLKDAGDYLVANPSKLNNLQRILISMQREDKGLSPLPRDGYLVAQEVSETLEPRGLARRRIVR